MQYEIKTATDAFSGYAARPLMTNDQNAYFVSFETGDSESYIELCAKCPDGRVVKCVGNRNTGGKAECFLDPAMYSKPGEVVLRISVVSGNRSLTVKEIYIQVKESFA